MKRIAKLLTMIILSVIYWVFAVSAIALPGSLTVVCFLEFFRPWPGNTYDLMAIPWTILCAYITMVVLVGAVCLYIHGLRKLWMRR